MGNGRSAARYSAHMHGDLARRASIMRELSTTMLHQLSDSKASPDDLDRYGPAPEKGVTAQFVVEGKDVVVETGWIYEVLEAHTRLRAQHGAQPLKWSNNCAERAQKLADLAAERGEVVMPESQHAHGHGVNVFVGLAGSAGATEVVEAWYAEMAKPGYTWPGDPEPSPGTSNFSQVVWKDTRQVGMACDTKGKGYIYADYWPAGNIQGIYSRNVLKEGTSAAGRNATLLTNSIVGDSTLEAIVSWPGSCEEEWNEVAGVVEVLRIIDPQTQFFSSACTFMPEGDPNYGLHVENDIDKTKTCFCYKLYGEPQHWGCKWFDTWRTQLKKVLAKGQVPVVCYKHRQLAEGDGLEWEDLPVTLEHDRRGLGPSQAIEVAFLRRVVGDDFVKKDIQHVVKTVQQIAWRRIKELVRGESGCRKFADAILKCPAAHEGIKHISLSHANLGVQGGRALGQVLPQLRLLQTLDLSDNNLGSGGAVALVRWLPPQLPHVRDIMLGGNAIRKEGAVVLAKVLPRLPGIRMLLLSGNNIQDVGTKAVAQALPELPHLEYLGLSDNNITAVGASALAEALPQLSFLAGLMLGGNRFASEGAQIMAECLPELRFLKNLDLSCNSLGPAGAEALAESISNLGALHVLDLADNNYGPSSGKALAEALHLSSVQVLWLGGNNLGQAIEEIGKELIELVDLRQLGLGGNNLKPEGMMVLAEAFINMHLSALWLHDNDLGEQGLVAFAQILPQMRRLQRVVLDGNNMGDIGAQALAEGLRSSPTVTKVLVNRNGIGQAGRTALHSARSDLF